MGNNQFVILSYPRTGSTFFVLKLHSSSRMNCYSELFHKSYEPFERSFYDEGYQLSQKKWYGNKSLGTKELFELRNKDFRSFLSLMGEQEPLPFGFKIFPGQHDEAMKTLVKDKNIKKIVLRREDALRNFVSYRLAMSTGKWDRLKGEKVKLSTTDIVVEDFLKYADDIDDSIKVYTDMMEESNQESLDLSFENITVDFPVKEVGDFLGISIDDMEPDVDRKRQNPFGLQEIVTNYDELAEGLKGTKWEKYLTN